MSQVERRPSRRIKSEPTPQVDAVRESFVAALDRYQATVAEVGVIQTCYVGKKPGLRTGFIWNVLTEDFTPEYIQQDPRFAQLSEGAVAAIAGSRDYLPLRIANVAPSVAPALRRRYELSGIILEDQPAGDLSTLSVQGADSDTLEIQNPVDTLIGGLEPADARIQIAHEIAQGAILDFGGDREEVEETMGLTMLDGIKEKKAAEILKDIALARNSAIEGGFARGLELLAEPTRVLQDIVENIYDSETTEGITELDVRGAIEAGVLVCSFGSQREYGEHFRKYLQPRE